MAIIKKILIILLVLLSLAGCKEERRYTPVEDSVDNYRKFTFGGKTFEYNTALKFVLIAGLDSKEFEGQTDFIGLFVFDREKETFKIFNIPREMVVETTLYDSEGNYISDTNTYINFIFSLNGEGIRGATKLANTVSSLINEIPITNFMIFPLDSIEKTLIFAEGLEYVIPNSSLEYLNPEWTEGTKIILNKENIYKVLRARNTNEDNSAALRRERQNAFMELLKNSETKLDINEETLKVFLDDSISNFSLNEYEAFYEMLKTYTFEGFVELPGEYRKADIYDEFYINRYEMYLLIKENFYM